MKTHYFTFGQAHVHRHGNVTLDKDIVVRITAKDPRARMFELFGQVWAFEYTNLDDVHMEYYKRGIYDINQNKIIKIGEDNGNKSTNA